MVNKTRWGIIGTGNIANQFARGLQHAADAELVAVGSRSQESADKFGDTYNVPRRYPTYEALAADSEVDAVYISTPHPYHKDNTLLCLDAGKAVLCEKPFAINAAESREMIASARSKDVFLMEAMWTRYLPAIVQVRELLTQGVIGEVRQVTADFGFRTGFNPHSRAFDPALGGGALLDVGIYPISFAAMVFGTSPTQIASSAKLGETGVDEESSYLLTYEHGQTALLSSAVRLNTPHCANIIGTEGWIEVTPPFWKADTLTLHINGKEPRFFDCTKEGNGYNYEAMEVGNCLRAGKLESSIMPLDETLALMETLDTIRAQWGMKYPGE